MLKNILNLEGAQKLTSTEQKSINGGRPPRVCELYGGEFGACGTTCYPANQSACTGSAYPVFVPNYFGSGKGSCCNY